MDKDKVKSQLEELSAGVFTVHDITEINHKPHMYTIGAKHVVHASKNNGCMTHIGCAHPHCGMDYVSHTFDTVVALKLLRNVTSDEANDVMQAYLPIMEKEGIDGAIFIETEECFRIA